MPGLTPRRRARRRAARPAARPRRGPIRVRPATRADLPLLVAHRRAMWISIRRCPRPQLDAHDRAYRRWVLREWGADRFAAFFAVSRSEGVLGSGAVWLVPAQPRPGRRPTKYLPYILSMYTVPSARGRGVASRIVRALVAWSRARGYPRVSLHASKMGLGVYAKLGFERTNEMRLDLRRTGRGRLRTRR